jgi:RNA polymerase sigma factor (sigma-70 family)
MVGNPFCPARAEPAEVGLAPIAMSPKASTRLLATQSDERLAALVRAGHDRAFEALVLRHGASLLRYCRRMPLSDTRAEDVVQQALLQAWTALRRGTEVHDLRAWLYRITHNTAVNVVRDAAREGHRVAMEPDGSVGAASGRAGAADSDLDRGLAAREALVSIAALPPMQREVIFRTAVAGYSHEEVASALGLSDGAVRGLLYRARVALRATITAITPPPLLTWMAGAGQGASAERIGELAASGGSIGLGGLLVKGGLVALTAGTLLTGAVIVHPASRRHTPSASASAGELASAGAPHTRGASLGWPSRRASADRPSSASASLRLSAGNAHRRLLSGTARARSWGIGGVVPPAGARPPRFGSLPKSTHAPPAPGPAGGSGAGAGQSVPPGQSPGPTAGPGGGSGEGSGSGLNGSPSGGSSGGSGSAGGGSGSGGGGTGSGGSGAESGGGGAGGSGGSTGGGSGGGNPPASPPSGGGGSGGGSGSGGSGGGSGGSGSGGSGGGSGSSGPVTTVVHEVTNLLESTVHGVLGPH